MTTTITPAGVAMAARLRAVADLLDTGLPALSVHVDRDGIQVHAYTAADLVRWAIRGGVSTGTAEPVEDDDRGRWHVAFEFADGIRVVSVIPGRPADLIDGIHFAVSA